MRIILRNGICAFALLSGVAAAAMPASWTADQDRADMMRQLGITALVPGPSGDEQAPNHANIDESKGGPVGPLPDPLTLTNGPPLLSSILA